MDRLSFDSFVGTTAYQVDKFTMEVAGTTQAIKDIKKYLTIEDKSVKFQLNRSKKTLKRFREKLDALLAENDRDAPGVPEAVEKYQEKIAVLEATIETLKPLLIVTYWEDAADGRIAIPIGMWWIPEHFPKPFHVNSTVVPVILPMLRDYQGELVVELLKWKRATGVLATGLGKTMVIASLCVSFQKAGKRCCVVVPTQDLVDQVYDTLSDFCGKKNVTRASGKLSPTLGADILVVTAASAKKWIGSYDAVLVDESHHAAADTWVELLIGAEQAEFVYNLTATPYRADGKDLAIHAFGGPVVYERDVRWGIANKWLEDFDVFTVEVSAKVGGRAITLGDRVIAARAYKTLMENPDVLGKVVAVIERLQKGGRMTMAMLKTVESGKKLTRLLLAKTGISADVASSQYKKPLKDFQKGLSTLLVSNEKLVGEGIDVPNVDSLVIATNHSANAMTMQILGRALRLKKGADKKRVVIIDIRLAGYEQFERAAARRDALYTWINGRTPQKLEV